MHLVFVQIVRHEKKKGEIRVCDKRLEAIDRTRCLSSGIRSHVVSIEPGRRQRDAHSKKFD